MYAGLNEEERDALAEVTRMGFPPGAWFDAERVRLQYTTVWAGLFDHFTTWDPTYFDDFWTVPGYLGENPPSHSSPPRSSTDEDRRIGAAAQARELGCRSRWPCAGCTSTTCRSRTCWRRCPPPTSRAPCCASRAGGGAITTSGSRDDRATTSPRASARRSSSTCARSRSATTCSSTTRRILPSRPTTATRCRRASTRSSTSSALAGRPIYPQRPQLLGPRFVRNNGAGRMDGRFAGKMIVVQSLFDEIAYPQQVEWYRKRIEAALGDRIDDQYRVWFTDHAMHQDPAVHAADRPPPPSIHSHRQLPRRARTGTARPRGMGRARHRPSPSTAYVLDDGQIRLPATALARRGIQPVVKLTANGGVRAEVAVGETVRFSALVEVPPGTGTIVAAEWDFEGSGDFPVVEPLTNEDMSYKSLTITRDYAFAAPGTYFPALRVTSQRLEQADNPHGRIMNLGRARVVVG